MESDFSLSHYESVCGAIGMMEEEGILPEKQLRRLLYKLGVEMYRSFHGLPPAQDINHPGRHAQAVSED